MWQIEVTSSVSSGNDDDKWHPRAFVSFTVEHNFSRSCHADDKTFTCFHGLSLTSSLLAPPSSSPEKCVLSRQSPAAAGATIRFRSLLSQSAFPIRLNALWRRGLLHDMILSVDKCRPCHKPDPTCGGGRVGVMRQTAWGPRDERSPQLY